MTIEDEIGYSAAKQKIVSRYALGDLTMNQCLAEIDALDRRLWKQKPLRERLLIRTLQTIRLALTGEWR